MYKNIGGTIKDLAIALFIFGSILSVVGGVFVIINADTDKSLVILGGILIVFGPIFSWIGTLCLYGFGELIEKTCDIAQDTSDIKRNICDSERINTIEQLHSQGVITEEEYQSKRAEIISKL